MENHLNCAEKSSAKSNRAGETLMGKGYHFPQFSSCIWFWPCPLTPVYCLDRLRCSWPPCRPQLSHTSLLETDEWLFEWIWILMSCLFHRTAWFWTSYVITSDRTMCFVKQNLPPLAPLSFSWAAVLHLSACCPWRSEATQARMIVSVVKEEKIKILWGVKNLGFFLFPSVRSTESSYSLISTIHSVQYSVVHCWFHATGYFSPLSFSSCSLMSFIHRFLLPCWFFVVNIMMKKVSFFLNSMSPVLDLIYKLWPKRIKLCLIMGDGA